MSSRIAVRRCREADLNRVLTIERASFGADAWPRELFLELLETNPTLFLVGTIGGEVTGYVAAVKRREAAELASLAVHPRGRGRGLARAMMKRVLARLESEGAGECWLTVRPGNRRAISLYRFLGFTRVRRVKDYYGPGRDGLRMRLRR